MKTKYLTQSNEFVGLPKLTDFKIVETEVDENLKEGEILTEAVCISIDPATRVFSKPSDISVMGYQTAKVLESKNAKYPKGSLVFQFSGWKTICKTDDETIWYRVDDITPKVSITHTVGALGMSGMTAYIAFLDMCLPKEGDTVMVNGCSGAVGSLVGQIAKIKGCRVVGCCGSEEKISFAKSIGFDEVFNYKTEKWPEALKRIAPEGIDCFFDNVGGQMASDIIHHMNMNGRVASVGCISAYNSKTETKVQADIIQIPVITNRISIRGFSIYYPRDKPKIPQAIKDMAQWIHEGKIKVRETVTDGFENIPKAFIAMLSGENIGKAVVRMSAKACES